jgi:hypothetical protein
LSNLEIEDCPLVEDILVSLPEEVLNAVEIISNERVEILFPLTDINQLQRKALGIGTAQSFVLFLDLCDHEKNPGRFGIHLDTDQRTDNDTLNLPRHHDVGTVNICRLNDGKVTKTCTSGSSPFKYHFKNMLCRHRKEDSLSQDLSSLLTLHQLVSHYLGNIGAYCSQCGSKLSVNLRKPTTCNSSVCMPPAHISYFRTQMADLVQLSGVLEDQLATDLLVSSIHAALRTKNPELRTILSKASTQSRCTWILCHQQVP